MNIILASQSPRRKELLNLAGIKHQVIPSDIDEVLDPSLSPLEQVKQLAYEKADAISLTHEKNTVIGVDTIVVLNDVILGKPKGKEDAVKTLRNLSGKTHEVMTAVCIINRQKNIIETFVNVTEVEFYEIDENWILNYVETKEPMDKAGSYGIQGAGFELVKKINGDYYSVMGLPIASLKRSLNKLGLI